MGLRDELMHGQVLEKRGQVERMDCICLLGKRR